MSAVTQQRPPCGSNCKRRRGLSGGISRKPYLLFPCSKGPTLGRRMCYNFKKHSRNTFDNVCQQKARKKLSPTGKEASITAVSQATKHQNLRPPKAGSSRQARLGDVEAPFVCYANRGGRPRQFAKGYSTALQYLSNIKLCYSIRQALRKCG